MSQFVVSARKYRPQRFEEVIGQNHVASTLKNALVNDQLAHAFLFCGPRGVGKTTCARILAKVLNCQNLQNNSDPCNECNSCTSFNDNASFNIIELDAASNNSVEHIRNLIEQVRFQPQQGSHKVFIIDEVHMLSSQAFNAFLKTLEEPPSYAVFILATTEKHKIIPTILSRCQIFDFKRIQNDEIVNQLKNIAYKEGIKYDEEALNIIAQKSDGAMRDALSIFDKVVSSTDRNINYQEVIENLNILDFDYYFKLTNAFLQEDLSSVFTIFNEILKKGFDAELCLLGLAEHIRELLVAKNSHTQALINGSDQLKERYINQSNLSTPAFLLNSLNILNQTDVNFQKAKNKRLHAEIALSKITHLNRVAELSSNPTLSVEKKTLDVNQESASKPKESISNISSETKTQIRVPEKKVTVPSAPATSQQQAPPETVAKVDPQETEPEVSIKPSKKIKIGFSSEDELLKEIEIEDSQKKDKLKTLDLEKINEMWEAYKERQTSQALKSSLSIKEIEIEGSKIIIHAPTPNVLKTIQQEEELITLIRESFDVEDLEIVSLLSIDKFPDFKKYVPKKKFTNREKYEILLQKNPSLNTFKETFQLKVDAK